MSKLITHCNNCCFLKYQKCTINKLDLYAKNGGTIEYHNNGVTIHGRFCNTKRNDEWLKRYKNDFLIQLHKETEIKYAVVFLYSNILELCDFLDFFEKETIKPQLYYLLFDINGTKESLDKSINILNPKKYKWKIISMDKDETYSQFLNKHIRTVTPIEEPYILYIDSFKKTRISLKNSLSKINHILNKELISILKFNGDGFSFFPTVFFKNSDYLNIDDMIKEIGHDDRIYAI